MSANLSQRIKRVSESATMQIAGETIRLKSQGYDIINFGVGEPDFDTPLNVKNSAKKALDENQTHYTLNRGTTDLRKAICVNLKSGYNVEFAPEEIIVTNGAKQALFNTTMVLIDRDDEVIIPEPCWPSYPELVNLTGGKAVFIKTTMENDFKITAGQLKNAITSKTKLFLFCNPNNPTGMTYSKKEIEELVEVLKGTGVFVVSDEIYGKLIYDNYDFVSFGRYKNELDNRVIVLQGASKAYAMTGWRMGYAAGPAEIIKACDLLQSHSTSNVSSISQYAAVTAFSDCEADVEKMKNSFDERRKYIISFVKDIPGFYFARPTGAFYIFPKVDSCYGITGDGQKITNSTDLTFYLLKDAHVAVVPGIGFGAEDHIRISYAVQLPLIKEGLDRIKSSISKIKKEVK
jgi:aspartate aminotransferase